MKKRNFKSAMALVAIVAAVSLSSMMTSCKKTSSSTQPIGKTLYDTLGGTALVKDPASTTGAMIELGYLNLRSVVDSAIFVIAADNKLNNKFFSVLLGEVTSGNLSGFTELSTNLTNFFATATGSTNTKYAYTGLSMSVAHNPYLNKRMGAFADAASFNQFVVDVAAGAAKNGVSADLVNNHIAPIIFSVEGQVVQKATLYDTLGGPTMVKDPTSASGAMVQQGYLNLRSVVDSAIFVIAADPKLNTKFFSVLLGEVGGGNLSGFTKLSNNLTNFFAVATGATDYTYTGLSMTAAHNPATNPRMGAKADSTDFNNFVGDVAKGAIQNGVSTDLINNHIAPIIFSVEGQVVQK